MPGWVGWPELLVLVVVLLLIFGPKRLPEMGRSMGKGLREFKDSISGKDDRESVGELTAANGEPSSFCSSCGNPVAADSQFCAKCGAPVAPGAYDSAVAARDAAPVDRDS